METVFINEFHYDNDGTDSNEFIEIAGPAGTDLTGWSIVLYNGSNGTSYNTINLTQTISDQSNGFGTVALDFPSNGIQNGGPDGIALVDNNGNVVEFLSYEGSFTATNGPAAGITSTDIGVAQSSSTAVNSSLQLQGTGSENSDFSWVAVDGSNTKGDINASQTFDNSTQNSITPIYDIQGAGHVSPLNAQLVTTTGIVTAVDTNGFYLQDATGDNNNATSDALFVFTGSNPTVAVGDEVEVSGTVSEFTPGGESSGNLSTTQISGSPTVTVKSSGNALPDATIIGNGGRVPPSENIDDDAFGSFEPDTDGIDFFESLEGMRVTAQDTVAVAPTNRFGEIFTVVDQGDSATGISERGTLNISADDFNPEKVQIDEDSGIFNFDFPDVNVGDSLGDVTGVVSYGFGNYEILVTEDFTSNITSGNLQPETTTIQSSEDKLTVASYNVLNLDPNDEDGDEDVANGRFDAIAEQIVNNLNSPDIIGLQEIQDNSGSGNDGTTSADETLQELIDAIVEAGGPEYEYIDNTFIGDNTSGGQPGGNIRNGYLYNPERVDYVEDSLSPITDSNAQQTDENNPFFDSRLSLSAKFTFNGEEVTVVNNHFSSKGGSSPILGIEQPFDQRQEDVTVNGSLDERQAQSGAVKEYVDGILAQEPDANVIVLGDFNEFEFVSPVENLEESLTNLTETLPEDERYTFNFQGNSQSLDHILVSDNLADNAEFDIVHVNSEFASTDQRASDHDPLIASFTIPSENMDKINLSQISTYTSEDGAEIVAHDPNTQRLFVTTGDTVEIIDISNPDNPTKVKDINISSLGGGVNSVAVQDGILAVAIEADNPQENGIVAFYNTNGGFKGSVEVGALPDMLTFTPDGNKILVANEGEPNDDYTVDPEGSISIIDISNGVENATVQSAGFTGFNDQQQELTDEGVRIFGPDATVAQDLEPEYIAVSEDGTTALVTLQENNAVAVVDIEAATVTDVLALGEKDHSQEGNEFDASDKDGKIDIKAQPTFGLYQPDAISSFEVDGKTYYITANEGDARDYDGFSEETRVEDLELDPTAYPDAETLQAEENLGRLKTTTALGDTDGDGDVDKIYSYGGRSFSIWDDEGNLVYDSGDEIAQILAEQTPEFFNANNGSTEDFDERSDDKGAEPESVTTGEVNGKTYAFIGLERAGGGVLVYDLSNPEEPKFNQYIRTEGDIAPEGLKFIAAEDSPNGKPMLAVANEVSNTTTLYEISENVISGDDGDNTISGAETNDFIDAGGGNDVIDPGPGDDIIDAGPGDDTITGGQGDNRIDGGEGIDTVKYTQNQDELNIRREGDQIKVGDNTDTLSNVEFLEFGDGSTLDTDTIEETYTLQILHASDLEGGVDAIDNAGNFAAIVDKLEDEYDNTVILSAGDNYIPGPFYGAAGDSSVTEPLEDFNQEYYGEEGLTNIRSGSGRVDISIMNAIGFDASAVGNHEFDAGTNAYSDIIGTDIRGEELDDVRWLGSDFPYLSANLDFSGDDNLSGLYTDEIKENTEYQANLDDLEATGDAPKIAKATIIEEGGEQIGVVGATTQKVGSISSTGGVEVIGGTDEDMDALAAALQPTIDELIAQGIDKIIVVSHLQQIDLEKELIGKLSGVDVIIAGGSDTLQADDTDRLREGDTATEGYPFETQNKDGDPAVIVSTDGEYSYVGRLVVEFDSEGKVILDSIDEEVSGAYATDEQGVEDVYGDDIDDAFAEGSKGEQVQALTDAVENVVNEKDSITYGKSDVFLEGRRSEVRTEETNLGNLTADANLAYAKKVDDSVVISIKNGGGIRSEIGSIDGSTGEQGPTIANPDTGKEAGEISQLDIENSLRFNNGLTLLTVTAEELLAIIEHGVSASGDGATPGQFPQVSGLKFSFDDDLPQGDRVQSLAVVDEDGNITDVIAENGELVGDASRTFRIVTLDFLVNDNNGNGLGGDNYPFPQGESANRVDLEVEDGERTGLATAADDGTEQDALAEYLVENFSETAFDVEDTPQTQDMRIQNLDFREDTVLEIEQISTTTLDDGTELEAIDLTGFDNQATVTVNYTISREADFDNEVYFYAVDDENGTVDGIKVGDEGYTEAALKRLVSPEFSVGDDTTQSGSVEFNAGSIVVPVIIADGTFSEALSGEAEIYFPYLGANDDNFDHIKLLDDNTFGFEDLANGGDQDFNDITIEINGIA